MWIQRKYNIENCIHLCCISAVFSMYVCMILLRIRCWLYSWCAVYERICCKMYSWWDVSVRIRCAPYSTGDVSRRYVWNTCVYSKRGIPFALNTAQGRIRYGANARRYGTFGIRLYRSTFQCIYHLRYSLYFGSAVYGCIMHVFCIDVSTWCVWICSNAINADTHRYVTIQPYSADESNTLECCHRIFWSERMHRNTPACIPCRIHHWTHIQLSANTSQYVRMQHSAKYVWIRQIVHRTVYRWCECTKIHQHVVNANG